MAIFLGDDTSEEEFGTEAADEFIGRLGNDTLFGLGGDDLLLGDRLISPASVQGLSDRDRMSGDAGNDRIYGGADNDLLNGGDGNDTLYGDYIDGGSLFGDDVLFGGAGDDLIVGGGGSDVLRGGPGDDTLFGSDGDDQLFGSHGDDDLRGGAGDDTINGGQGNDTVRNSSGNDRVEDLFGNNLIIAQRGVVETGDGWDNIRARIVLSAGDGNDIILLFGPFAAAGGGNDRVSTNMPNAAVYGQAGNDQLNNIVEGTLFGGPGNDTLRGIGELFGGAGNDRLVIDAITRDVVADGGAGDDYFSAQGSRSSLTGGAGADQFASHTSFSVESANVITDFEQGIDTIGIGVDFPDSFEFTFENDVSFIQAGRDVLILNEERYIARVLDQRVADFTIDDFFGFSI